ncbi:peptide ABC transporter permease [Amphritea balenae]|uniref:Peptide ABC transporter permease n=2 Tax=Amphritea balenae TaxID=452629 RepID=A0A3P1SXK6_9GAMM|nr:peptide ABC transporter permease [Amphritea balenae]
MALFFSTSPAIADQKDLIVIAAPSIVDTEDDLYYAEVFDDIIEFDIVYANAVLGHDEILILVDAETRPYFTGRVPEQILIESDPQHIWMRDFTTVNPYRPVQFRYTSATFENNYAEADEIQADFNYLLKQVGIGFDQARYKSKKLLLDGGNIVDNYAGRVITTERFLEDNRLSRKEGIAALKQLLGATEVAIIPGDDPVMAHSDGMVMFSDENTLFVNRYEGTFRTRVLDELKSAFPGIRLIEVDAKWDEGDSELSVGSACGINLNATVTSNFIYMPHFGDIESDDVMKLIAKNSEKTVIPVPAKGVCKLGGSVRCLSWQQSGDRTAEVIRKLRRFEN